MLDKLLKNFTLIDFLVGLCVGVIIYVLAAFVGIFLSRHKEFMVPVIFGLMYSNYISFRPEKWEN